MTQLVVIPARAGSKGIPGKNSKLLAGKPLIQYTIEAALEVFDSNQICVSTDSLEIKNLAEKLGLKVPFKRPPELASDYASTRDVLLHAMEFYGNRGTLIDQIVLLQPTSPFRTGRHIEDALHLYSEDLDMVASVQKTKSNQLRKSQPVFFEGRLSVLPSMSGSNLVISKNSFNKKLKTFQI